MSISLYNSDIHYWLAATQLPKIGPVFLQKWRNEVGEISSIFTLSVAELTQHGFTPEQINAVQTINWDAIERTLIWCKSHNCHVLTWVDAAYPSLLLEIATAPAVLFVQGDVDLLQKPQIALVGSRSPTTEGRKLAGRFAEQLVARGFVITSGLALGIDTASHQGALQAEGKTIGVLGSGLQQIYPPANRKLAEQVIRQGALVSEFLPDERPKAHHFPQRNRIISGLSLGVLVVEAALKSGSLITARMAGDQGREVFAIPGSISNPKAHGCHQLIRQGAKLVETAQDIVEELGPLRTVFSTKIIQAPIRKLATIDEKSQQLLTKIGYEITPLDAIIIQSGLTTTEVSSMLLLLELEGYVQAVPGGYQRK